VKPKALDDDLTANPIAGGGTMARTSLALVEP
jgi:hypothetical protein